MQPALHRDHHACADRHGPADASFDVLLMRASRRSLDKGLFKAVTKCFDRSGTCNFPFVLLLLEGIIWDDQLSMKVSLLTLEVNSKSTPEGRYDVLIPSAIGPLALGILSDDFGLGLLELPRRTNDFALDVEALFGLLVLSCCSFQPVQNWSIEYGSGR